MTKSTENRYFDEPVYNAPDITSCTLCTLSVLCSSGDNFETTPLDGQDYGNY